MGQSTWSLIREGANDVERLIGQKQYNLAMIKARQSLEVMVRELAEKNGLEYTDLKDTIDELYQRRIITKTTLEHYHTIRMIGNKAVHENDNNPTGANTAYHLLSQELYSFADDYSRKRISLRTRARDMDEDDVSAQSVRHAAHRHSSRNKFSPEILFKITIPILVLILIAAIVNFFMIKNGTLKEEETTLAESEVQVETIMETWVYEEATIPETETEYKQAFVVKGDVVNVRTKPNTECEILGQVKEGETIEFVSDYDSDWVEISYNGQKGYIKGEFIEEVSSEEGSEVDI